MSPRALLVAILLGWAVRPGGPRPRRREAMPVPVPPRRRSRALPRVMGVGLVLVITAIVPLAGLGLGAVLVWRSARSGRRADRRRLQTVERTLPETIDLISLVVSAGLPARRAMYMAAPRCPEPHRSVLIDVLRRIEAGESAAEAIPRLTHVLGPPLQPLVTALVAAERDGVALVPALERCADEAHRRRRVRAEEAARRVPVLMLFPLVLCVLPAFGLLTVVPLLAGSVSDLQLPA